MRQCIKCGESKEENEFYAGSKKCKSCATHKTILKFKDTVKQYTYIARKCRKCGNVHKTTDFHTGSYVCNECYNTPQKSRLLLEKTANGEIICILCKTPKDKTFFDAGRPMCKECACKQINNYKVKDLTL